MKHFSANDMEQEVLRARRDGNLLNVRQLNGKDLWDVLPKILPGVEIQVLPDDQVISSAAVADLRKGRKRKLTLRQTIYNRLILNCATAIFIVLHEVGHFRLEHEGYRRRADVRDRSAMQGSKASIQEGQANAFARAFIAPFHLASQIESASELTVRFDLEKKSAERRFSELQEMKRGNSGSFSASKYARPVGDPCPNPNCGDYTLVRIGLLIRCEKCRELIPDFE